MPEPHDRTPIAWRVYYADGSTVFAYRSQDAAWADLPTTGAQCVVVYERGEYLPGRHYRRILAQGDWYGYDVARNEFHIVTTHREWGQREPAPSLPGVVWIRGDAARVEVYEAALEAAHSAEVP